jgi:predicted nucleic acid-binding protein
MKDKVFIDSNIFLYAFTTKDINKQKISAEIICKNYTISTQVINEVSSNMIKKLNFSNQDVNDFVLNCYEQYYIVNFSKEIFIKASTIRIDYNISYYDSLIIATALENNCTILYSEDMQHNQIIEDILTIKNPFKREVFKY